MIGDGKGSGPSYNAARVEVAVIVAETPIDEPGDDRRNVEALTRLVKK